MKKRGDLKKAFLAAALFVSTAALPVAAGAATHTGADPEGYINLNNRTNGARIEMVEGAKVDESRTIILDGRDFISPGPYEWQFAVLLDKAKMEAAMADANARTLVVDFNGAATPNRDLPVFDYDVNFRGLGTTGGDVSDMHPLTKLSKKSMDAIRKAGGFALRLKP